MAGLLQGRLPAARGQTETEPGKEDKSRTIFLSRKISLRKDMVLYIHEQLMPVYLPGIYTGQYDQR